MTFFNDPSDCTHYGTFYGLPVYFRSVDDEGPTVIGHNVVVDLLLEWVVPVLHWLDSVINYHVFGRELSEWRFSIDGDLPRSTPHRA